MKIHKSRTNKVIAGVCGGIAETYGWDPTIVRIVWVILSLLPIPTHPVIIYIILSIFLPAY